MVDWRFQMFLVGGSNASVCLAPENQDGLPEVAKVFTFWTLYEYGAYSIYLTYV